MAIGPISGKDTLEADNRIDGTQNHVRILTQLNSEELIMFSPSRVIRYAWGRAARGAAQGQRVSSNHLNNPQVLNAVNQHLLDRNPRPFQTFLQICGIIFGTITVYSVYQVAYKGEETFVPLYVSKTRRPVRQIDQIDEKLVKVTVEEQLLERLSLNSKIQQEFRLPVILSESKDFEIWIEERDTSIKGLEISPKKPHFSRVDKPIKLPKLSGVLEPIGGDEPYEIPVVNQNERDYDVWFSGTARLASKAGNGCEVVFKGTFDFEHVKQAQLKHVHLVKLMDGKKKKEVLW